jgi:hypothetical protein
MKYLNIEKATDRYNGIMLDLCADHLTIGIPSYSEGTDGWNLRDMVAECDYLLSTYYDPGHTNYDMKDSDDEDERKAWRSETGKLKRFIAAYEQFISEMRTTEDHCSKYDNTPKKHKLKEGEHGQV